MTRTTNARVAGFTLLFYIATGLSALVLAGRATAGEGVAAKLASIAKDPRRFDSRFCWCSWVAFVPWCWP